jgi:hypothetical protein
VEEITYKRAQRVIETGERGEGARRPAAAAGWAGPRRGQLASFGPTQEKQARAGPRREEGRPSGQNRDEEDFHFLLFSNFPNAFSNKDLNRI